MATNLSFNQTLDSVARNLRAPAREDYRKACVLVVEDHEDTRFMLRTMLERHGTSVVEAENGEMAIALAANVRLDLILMDGSLPVLDGFAATRRIRELAFAREVPIIFLSGHAMPAAQVQAFNAGCNGYLVKPIDFDEWDRVLEQYLPQRESN